MTTSEAIKHLFKTLSAYKERCNSEWCDKDKEALKVLTEELEKVDKYKWHDLSKNPEDLPIRFKIVLVYSDFKYNVAFLGRAGWYDGDCYISTPVVWRYIEQF